MADPDNDTEPERSTDPRFDNWPIEQYEAYSDYTVERASPADTDEVMEQGGDTRWLGFIGTGLEGGVPVIYEPRDGTIHGAELDEEGERVVLREETVDRELETEDEIRDHIEELGEEREWQWLSPYARRILTVDEEERGYHAGELDLEHSTFTQKNVAPDDPADLAFDGSHTFRDDEDRVSIVEREFDVFVPGDDDVVTVDVDDWFLLAEEPNEERRAGDAEMTDRRSYDLGLRVDADDPAMETRIEEAIEEWHLGHLGSPAGQ